MRDIWTTEILNTLMSGMKKNLNFQLSVVIYYLIGQIAKILLEKQV